MTYSSRSGELNQFKTDINLCDFASTRGFQLDKNQTSRASAILKHPNGDKLVVSRGANRHWKYFNVHDQNDSGTIIDFLQVRERLSLGEVRKELRSWLRGGCRFNQITPSAPQLLPVEQDLEQVFRNWENARLVNGRDSYLQKERRIPASILEEGRFHKRIRRDKRGNLLFAHYNETGLSGYEVKNRRFTGFSAGGLKGLFCSRPHKEDHRLVICETAIDSLSYAALFGTEQTRFLSTAGQVSPLQLSLLQSAMIKMPEGSEIVLAMDNDTSGLRLAEVIKALLTKNNTRQNLIRTHFPDQPGTDWNDLLRSRLACRVDFPVLCQS